MAADASQLEDLEWIIVPTAGHELDSYAKPFSTPLPAAIELDLNDECSLCDARKTN